jgi:hypothetical protein
MTVLQIGHIIFGTVQIFTCFVVIVGMRKWKKLSPPLRFFEVFLSLGLIVTFVEGLLADHNIRNLWMQHWVSLFELSAYSYLYFVWRPSNRYGRLLWTSYCLYIAIWIIGKYSFEPFYYTDVYSGAISQIIQIGFGGWLLFQISQEQSFEWRTDPRFIVVTGIASYAAASFLLFSMFNLLLTLPRQTMRVIWLSNSLFVIIQYSIFLRAFLCKPKVIIGASPTV